MSSANRSDDRPVLPQRRRPAHGVSPSPTSQASLVFLTVCTHRRAPVLADSSVHAGLVDVWCHATEWLVGRYVVMPDHLHLFAAADNPGVEFDAWVRYWKSQFIKTQRKRLGLSARLWQTDHWDTRVRSLESYEAKWEYVRNNPVRKGLVLRSEEWPYQGTVFDWQWAD